MGPLCLPAPVPTHSTVQGVGLWLMFPQGQARRPEGHGQAVAALLLELPQEQGEQQTERAMETQTCHKLWVWH